MTDKLGLGPGVRQIKLGASFTGDKSAGFHTLRYDFKPASVDPNKIATVDVGASNQISVTVPHLDGAGTQQTVFKGSYRPYQKECVLIIDKVTGEITLEKLSNNIQLKKTRTAPQKVGDTSKNVWKNTDIKSLNANAGSSSKLKTNSGLVPRHSPLHASPSPSPAHHKSPNRPLSQHKSPPQLAFNNRSASPSFQSHNPVLGVEETSMTGFETQREPNQNGNMECAVGVLSSSSDSGSNSDSSSSDSDSDSSSMSDSQESPKARVPEAQSLRPNGHLNSKPTSSPVSKLPSQQILSQDLQLSESDSDF
ncbi:unnamed protein product [Bemisia tabaci]|uniref:Ell-associated factor Eaf n=1 Tax=Bemisia tabaci TaxID=7038 RepID=A0A9P0A779_BEMTA|nr:PREDICTED: ELL-associated factor 1 [Bemisia tabaci]CAH0385701.1 unnamed protein product [Bemisia tabaci]